MSSCARITVSSIDLLMTIPPREGPVDDGAGVAQVVFEVEGAIDLGRVEARRDVLVGRQQLAELALAGHGAQRVSLHQLVGGLARHPLAHQRQHHRLAEVEALGLLQVLAHALARSRPGRRPGRRRGGP